jgi:pyruvate/oxaloacetate carboxyltransferase
VWGEDLKADLQAISSCYKNMTNDEKQYYEINFGNYPPPIQNSITYNLWQKYMRPWTPKSGNLAIEMPEETKKKMAEKINKIIDAYNKTKV